MADIKKLKKLKKMYRDFKYKLAEDTISNLEITKLSKWLIKSKRLTQSEKLIVLKKIFQIILVKKSFL